MLAQVPTGCYDADRRERSPLGRVAPPPSRPGPGPRRPLPGPRIRWTKETVVPAAREIVVHGVPWSTTKVQKGGRSRHRSGPEAQRLGRLEYRATRDAIFRSDLGDRGQRRRWSAGPHRPAPTAANGMAAVHSGRTTRPSPAIFKLTPSGSFTRVYTFAATVVAGDKWRLTA